MTGEAERCAFLSPEGRCGIHESRPGVCRLFPLGRYYENGDFQYFLQTGECREENRLKVKVGKWIDTPRRERYHEFIRAWHYFLNGLEERLAGAEEEERKRLNLLLLNTFYMSEYKPEEDFYEQFAERQKSFEAEE